jgi:hypothetical protein
LAQVNQAQGSNGTQERSPDPAGSGENKPGIRNLAPAWLKLGVELRGRAESGNTFDETARTPLYLNRVRLNVAVQPGHWVRFFIQGQDARVFGPGAGRERAYLQDTIDVRQAYLDLGHAEGGWLLRAGRQELAFGDERLMGADDYWDCFGQSFDAVRLGFARGGIRVDAFTGFRVQAAHGRLDPFDENSRISGLAVHLTTSGEGALEPYVLWKRGGVTRDLSGGPGHRDVLTEGVRAQGALPHSLEYNVEMGLQRGHVVNEEISAWAGHWEVGWKPLGLDSGLRLGIEYNYASGDEDAHDGKHGTFDDLYPAGFNKCGIADPIAWRNIRYPGIGAEVPVAKAWTIYATYRRYWLANIHDGLYPGGDEYLVRNPAARGSEVGAYALASVAYTRSEHWRFYAGYGRLAPGEYLRESGYQAPLRTAYVQSSFTF